MSKDLNSEYCMNYLSFLALYSNGQFYLLRPNSSYQA